MDVEILNLYSNVAQPKTSLIGDHGQSFLISTKDEKILFDVGTNGKKLLYNMKLLEVNPNDISLLILSHGHNDHTGGLPKFLESRTTDKILPIIAHNDVLVPRRVKVAFYRKDAGFPKLTVKQKAKMKYDFKRTPQQITKYLRTTGEITERPYQQGIEPKLQWKNKEGNFEIDPVKDDTSLIITTKEGQVIVTGCAHAGILNICKHAKDTSKIPIKAIFGGTHMANYSIEEVYKTGEKFVNEFDNPDLYLNHCTDKLPVKLLKTTKVIDILREKYGEKKIKNCYVGTKVTYTV